MINRCKGNYAIIKYKQVLWGQPWGWCTPGGKWERRVKHSVYKYLFSTVALLSSKHFTLGIYSLLPDTYSNMLSVFGGRISHLFMMFWLPQVRQIYLEKIPEFSFNLPDGRLSYSWSCERFAAQSGGNSDEDERNAESEEPLQAHGEMSEEIRSPCKQQHPGSNLTRI